MEGTTNWCQYCSLAKSSLFSSFKNVFLKSGLAGVSSFCSKSTTTKICTQQQRQQAIATTTTIIVAATAAVAATTTITVAEAALSDCEKL